MDVFFVVNRKESAGTVSCLFEKVLGRCPELWDPTTGIMRDLPDFNEEKKGIRCTLKVEPLQSYFIVFRKVASVSEKRVPNFPEFNSVKIIDGPWNVSFDPKWGGPDKITFETLDDWTTRAEPGIRYYSGTAIYTKSFDFSEMSKFNHLRLDLGEFNHLARVRINGQELGVVWCKPNSTAIPTGLLKESGNKLEIEITNVWANRLIGDEKEPPDCEWQKAHLEGGYYLKRFPDWFVKNEQRPSKGRYCFVTWNYFLDGAPSLAPSGLRGPVQVMGAK
jgi:hypothetical protein